MDAALEIDVPAGARVLIASDLHLGALAHPTSEAASVELARRIDGWTGPGVVVLAGDVFELWGEPNNTPAKALRSHPRFAESVARFASGPGRSVVVLAGNHDGALGWDESLANEVRELLGAEVGQAVDLRVATGAGVERVRVEHGHQLDPHNAFLNCQEAGDRPLGQHIVAQVLPGIKASGGAEQPWLADVDGLVDPSRFPTYVASRLVYRRLARHLWWAAVPVVAVAGLRLAAIMAQWVDRGAGLSGVSRIALFVLLGLVADVALLAAGVGLASRRMVGALKSIPIGSADSGGPSSDRNAAARRRAIQLHNDGYRGYITGHTHSAELVDLDGAFFANTGCNTAILAELPARAGLPPVFRPGRQSAWVELEAGARLHAEVWLGQSLGDISRLERMAARRVPAAPARPAVAASLAAHCGWPVPLRQSLGRRGRRLTAGLVAVIGVTNLLSAFTPPLGGRFREVVHVVPFAVPETATFATAATGIALLLLAGGIRRGQRRAWRLTIGILAASVVANLLKGLDIEEAAASLLAGGWLFTHSDAFRGRVSGRSTRRALAVLAAVGAAAAVASLVVSSVASRPFAAVAGGFVGRMAGMGVSPLPGRLQLFSAAATAVGLATIAGAGWLLLRPRSSGPSVADTDARAWALVQRHGRGTLDYFALRDDKARYVWDETVVAYAIRGGVAVVSPDPIGPADERAGAWAAFRRHAAGNGWPVAVIGAGEEWLATYRADGMTVIYAGDEGVVDVAAFSLDGGRNKTLRQAVNRVRNAGYRIEFHDPATLSPELAGQLTAMAGASRRGHVERGFSMTLSRMFDPRDAGLLLAIAFAPDGAVAAFCQYVPAPGIDGYSLDLMRRAEGDHPNGLTDFVVVSTIQHLQAEGRRGLGLNFAAMRAVLAGEVNDSWFNRRQRWLLRRLGRQMQIESLWHFNAKYDPKWAPRYLAIDGPEQIFSAAFAVASAESLWELPLLGRFLRHAPARP